MESQSPMLATSRLTPQFCFSTSTLQEIDFLRLSRATIDDTIQQRLNSLATPSTRTFTSSSTSSTYYPRRDILDPTTCISFRDTVLFPSWQARAQVLRYCSSVASSPDPEDPSSSIREAEQERERSNVVDERLDPYSGRFFPTEARTERLAGVLRTEDMVEKIVRARTWEVVRGKCLEVEMSGERAFAEWEKKNGGGLRKAGGGY